MRDIQSTEGVGLREKHGSPSVPHGSRSSTSTTFQSSSESGSST